jgi:hypothetical protein
MVCVLFSECPLELNHGHRSIPECELLFVVRPCDHCFYLINCHCKDPTFWCGVLEKRLIAAENISAAICRSVFQFVALNHKEMLFAKNREREAFLSGIEKVPISLLTLVQGYALESVRE